MDLIGKLTLESRQQIQQLMRLVAAGRVMKRPVKQLLEHQVPMGMCQEIGPFQKPAEVFQVSVKVPGHHNLGRAIEVNQMAFASGSILKSPDGLANGSKKAGGIRHGKLTIEAGRSSPKDFGSWLDFEL